MAAPTDEIRERIAPLGLSKRARYLELLSAQLVARHGGRVPKDRSALTDLHGVGEYTARSVLIHAHGDAISAADTNVERLLSRFFGLDSAERDVAEFATELAPRDRPGDFLHAMLDFAAAVCTARSPACDDCPIRDRCDHRNGDRNRDAGW